MCFVRPQQSPDQSGHAVGSVRARFVELWDEVMTTFQAAMVGTTIMGIAAAMWYLSRVVTSDMAAVLLQY